MSDMRLGSLEYRISQLETQLTRVGLAAPAALRGFSSGSCTNNCTAACTIGCTKGCTDVGCTEPTSQPQVGAEPASAARMQEGAEAYQRLRSQQSD
jgi:hypothetical protein